MLLMKTIIFLLFVAIPCCVIAQNLPDTAAWKSFSKAKYSINYPSDWKLDTSRLLGSDAFFFSPKDNETDKFSENVNIMVQDLKGMSINLDRYAEISEGQIKTIITDGQVLESKRISVNGQEFHRLHYTGRQGVFSLKTLQYYFISDEKAFVVTLVTEADKYEKYEETGVKIMNSFKLQ